MEVKPCIKDVSQAPFYKDIFTKILNSSSSKHGDFDSSDIPSGDTSLQIIKEHYSRTIVLNELIFKTLSSKLANQEEEESQKDYKVWREMDKAFKLLELRSYVTPVSQIPVTESDKVKSSEYGEALNLFGIEEELLQTKAKELIGLKHLKLLKSELQVNLIEQCNQIISFNFHEELYHRTSVGMNAVVEATSQLKKNCDSRKILLAKQRQFNSDMLRLVFLQMIEYEKILDELVNKYRTTSHPLPHLEFLATSQKAYLLKLKCLKMEVLTLTYSSSSVSALKRLQEKLRSEENELDRALAQVDHRLSSYEGLEPKFFDLLKEYSGLQRDLKFFKA